MAIANHIEKVRQGIREGRFTSEAAVSQGILLPALHELGWPVFDTSIVIPEFSVEGRRKGDVGSKTTYGPRNRFTEVQYKMFLGLLHFNEV